MDRAPCDIDAFAYASDLHLAYDPTDWRSIRRFLEKLGVTAPASVWTEVAYDSTAKQGCRVIRHLSDGISATDLAELIDRQREKAG